MDVQTSTVGTENCDNIEYNERTIVAGWAKKNMHISFGVPFSRFSTGDELFISHSPCTTQNLILYARLSLYLLCWN